MVLLRFTKLINKVRSGEKRQTIRLPRKNPIKIGDTLQVYVLEKLGEAKVKKIETKRWVDITEEDAILDGFDSLSQCLFILQEMHKWDPDDIYKKFDIITFDPEWTGE